MKKNVLFSIVLAFVFVFGGIFSSQAKEGRQSPVQDLIRSLEVGKPVSYGSLTVNIGTFHNNDYLSSYDYRAQKNIGFETYQY